jgi:hypothetical protein
MRTYVNTGWCLEAALSSYCRAMIIVLLLYHLINAPHAVLIDTGCRGPSSNNEACYSTAEQDDSRKV